MSINHYLRCLRCKKLIGQHTGFRGNQPREGDLSICGNCGHCAIFVNGVTQLRETTVEEQTIIMGMPEVKLMLEQLGFV